MINNLLPCPFCGGEAACHFDRTAGVYEITCEHCYQAGTTLENTEAKAIAAWNTRAERMPRSRDELLAEMRAINDEWVQERTCHVDGSISYDVMYVTEYEHDLTCGHTVTTLDREPPNYCPECGAKVMTE